MSEMDTESKKDLAANGGRVPRLVRPWPDYNEERKGDRNETQDLVRLVELAWDTMWPGWDWVTEQLNRDHGNSRTRGACLRKYSRMATTGILRTNSQALSPGETGL
jgi:hypothetical protein